MSTSPISPVSPPPIFTPEDLACPISRETMKKVATLSPCGHSFDEIQLKNYFGTASSKICPLCRQLGTILPSEEALTQMLQSASKRAALQAACEQHRAEHPEEEEPNPNTNILENLERNENGPHIILNLDGSALPENMHFTLATHDNRIEFLEDDGIHLSLREIHATYSNHPVAFSARVNPNPLQPTVFRVGIAITPPLVSSIMETIAKVVAGCVLGAIVSAYYPG